jgi:cell division protein FtsL
MIRLSSVFWVLLVSATALATFAVKYEVQALDDQLADARKATASENRERRVLDAEWAYLNRPDMLAAMNQRFLSLVPITRKQLQTAIADIPMRPAPAAPPAAAPVPETGPVAAVDAPPPGNALPVAQASLDRAAAPERLAMASASVKPILVKATVTPGLPSLRTRSLAGQSLAGQRLASRSLDQLIARIAAGR